MSAGHTVTTHPEALHVEVKVDGVVVAVTDRPVLLEETGLPTRYYLPREDVKADLAGTSFRTECPFKGSASYWSLDVDGTTHDGIAWSYEDPIEAAAGIKGLLCFWPDRAEISVG